MPEDDAEKRKERAEEIRRRIRELEEGRPDSAPSLPKSDRERVDEATRGKKPGEKS